MNPEFGRVKEVFLAALEREDRAVRETYLRETCGTDEALRRQVEALLSQHEQAGSFLDGPPADLSLTVEQPATEERPGMVVGPYKLLQQLGEGGMGTVFMAEQTHPVQRKVALKLIRPGMDSRQVLARFEAERQALALMDHPNIARVLDAGTTDRGRPYFVMELVKGVPITRYCDDHRLTCEDRLGLFVPVCRAIQHAHQKGIIHRDLKPSNVMVCLYDGRPVPKVIDFGVAKATGQRLTDKTLFTEFGSVVGTLEYMSPEQAEVNQLDVDTRSDVYSLGVLLYELLTGTTPLERGRFKEVTLLEVLRLIREEEPPKPSTRLSTTGGLPAIAADRGLEPKRLSGLVRGELDWIAMRALEKDRSRRYETAGSLAADVQRYLADEPVQACPPSAGYRLRKFGRRNKRAVVTAAAGGLVMVTAVAGLATSTLLIASEQRATANALQAETRAKDDLKQTNEGRRVETYFHLIALAHRELSADNLSRALELLKDCPEDLRGWEWRYLTRHCKVEPVILHDKTEANSLAFSADGESLVAACGDGTIKVWDTRTRRVVRTIPNAHDRYVSSVAFHPGDKYVASVGLGSGQDKKVKVWDLATGTAVFSEPCDAAHTYGTAHAVAFSPDGRRLAAGDNGSLSVWDWEGRRLLHRFDAGGEKRLSVAFSGDGGRLASGSWRGSVRLWDPTAEGKPMRVFTDTRDTRHPACALAFSPDSRRLAAASFDRRVDVWETATGELVHRLPHGGLVLCVAFSPDGRRLASGGEDKTVHLWDAATGREVLGLRGHTGACGCVAFSPDGQRLASASLDGDIRIWDATPLQGDERQEFETYPLHGNEVWTLAPSRDGRVVSGGFGTPAKVWNAQTGRVSAEFDQHRDIVFCAAWRADGQRIATAGADGGLFTVKVWNPLTGREVFTLPGALPGDPEFLAVAFNPDGRYLVTGRTDGRVQVWDGLSGDLIRLLGTHKRVVRGAVFSSDGKHLATVSADGDVNLWDATRLDKEQRPRATVRGRVHGPGLNIAFSPDGERLATGGEENSVKIWAVRTAEPLHTLRGHGGDVYAVAFSPDGWWIASAGEDSTVKVWDSHTNHGLVRSFRGHTGLVSSVAFSPNPGSPRLYSGSRDRTVKVWDVSKLGEEPTR